MFLVFWTLRFKSTFSLSSCNVIKRPFSSSSLSATRVLSSACLTLLLFLPAILISACASFSPEFLIMCSAYTSNKQGDQTQPWRTAFPIWSQSVVSCPLLTLASSPASSFLKCLDFVNLVSMYLFICLLKLFCKALFVPLGPIDSFLFLSSEIFNYNLFKNFSYHIFFLSSSSGTPILWFSVCLILLLKSLRLSSILFLLSMLYCSSAIISRIFFLQLNNLFVFFQCSVIDSFYSIFNLSNCVVCLFSFIFSCVQFVHWFLHFLNMLFNVFWSCLLLLFWILMQVNFLFPLYSMDFCVSIFQLHLCSISLHFYFHYYYYCLLPVFEISFSNLNFDFFFLLCSILLSLVQ